MTAKSLQNLLDHVHDLFAAGGARKSADAVAQLNSMLEAEGADKRSLNDVLNDIDGRMRPPSQTPDPVELHVARLIDAGTDEVAFGNALEALKSDRTVRVANLQKIAEGYGISYLPKKTKAAIFSEIQRRFVENARAANKLRMLEERKVTPW